MYNHEPALSHFGIPGMQWGVGRTDKELGNLSVQKARSSNLDKWGEDQNHNILYITGYSGSGKSTAAKQLSDDKTDTVHLDIYLEKPFSKATKNVSSRFIDYLQKNASDYSKMSDISGIKDRKEKWKMIDEFQELTEKFGRDSFASGRKVIIEGVQLQDETLYPYDKSFFSDKPMVILGTNALTSVLRARARDNMSSVSLTSARNYVKWYLQVNKNLNILSDTIGATRGNKLKHFEMNDDHEPFFPIVAENSDQTWRPSRSKSIDQMDNDELVKFIERAQIEQRAKSIIRILQDYETGSNPITMDTPIKDLYHHGILGMKWGRRRYQNEDGTRTAAGKAREAVNDRGGSEDYASARTYGMRGISNLSNAELRQLNERLQLEKSYSELTSSEKKRNKSFGMTVLAKIGEKTLTDSGSKLATGILTKVLIDPVLSNFDAKKKR